MPIREKSFRIGCGRYLQEAGLLSQVGAEVLRLGKAPLIVGGPTALSLTKEKIEKSVSAGCAKYLFVEHPGTCNDERAMELADLAEKEGYDVIVGVGGGVLMDFSKLCGYYAKLPVINLPTSSATCACYTPLSVRYTPEGRTVGSRHYDYEVDAVLADTEIIAKQPIRLLLAGVFDALAKFVEIKQRFNETTTEFPIGLDWAYVMSKHSYQILNTKTMDCIADMEKGILSDTVEQLIFTALAGTGVISGIARGSNQTALAHKFYESTRTLFHETARPYLHGEIVGIGLLLQNHFNGEEENNTALRELMKGYGMPGSISEIGVTADDETKERYYDLLSVCSAVETEEERIRLRAGLDYLWGLN